MTAEGRSTNGLPHAHPIHYAPCDLSTVSQLPDCLNAKSSEERAVYKRPNSTNVDSKNKHGGSSRNIMYSTKTHYREQPFAYRNITSWLSSQSSGVLESAMPRSPR